MVSRQLEAGDSVAHDVQLPPIDLPEELASFVGREHEIVEVAHRLHGARLLTLIGAGGIGKTRLALEVAERCRSVFADGARFVNLAPINDAAIVAQAIAQRIGTSPGARSTSAGDAVSSAADASNCCWCWTIASTFCQAVRPSRTRSSAPALTCGSWLPVASRWEWPARRSGQFRRYGSSTGVGKCPFEALLVSEAGRLFVERATAAQSSFMLRADNAQAVAEICWQLDGIPLAIELAAVRVRGLTVAQIASRLGDQLRLLSSGSRASPPRHQTLRAAIDWSYRLLSEGERRLFNRLSVFAGGWTLQAAVAVCSGWGWKPTMLSSC